MEEKRLCHICGENYILEDDDLCDECFSKNCTLENCLEIGKEITEQYELNGFLASVFSVKSIENCLISAFMKLPQDRQEKLIEEYCGEDKFFFSAFLEEKAKNGNLH